MGERPSDAIKGVDAINGVGGSLPRRGITKAEHDDLDRVTRTTDQLGDTVAMVYDATGRLLKRDYRTRANSPSGTVADTDTFTYDAASRMLTAASGRYSNTVTYVYDASGRKLSESLTIGGQTYTTSTSYDTAGRVSLLTYRDASEVTRTYTGRSQLHKIIAGGTTLDTRSYDDGGRMTSSVYDNGVSESRFYNVHNTLREINFAGASIGDLSYSWDANHNKTSETNGGVMSDYGFTASYDAEDWLEPRRCQPSGILVVILIKKGLPFFGSRGSVGPAIRLLPMPRRPMLLTLRLPIPCHFD